MKKLLVLLLALPFVSCKLTYYHPSSQRNRVEQVLGVTTAGDTIQVPIDYFGDRINRQYDFNLEYFYWRNDWWLYNNPSLYNRSWFYRNYWWNPYTPPIIIQNPRPRYSQPRVRTRRNEVKPQPNRGRTNQQPRTPQYVRPSQQRPTVTPNRNNNRNTNTPQRSGNNSRTTNGGRPIKQ